MLKIMQFIRLISLLSGYFIAIVLTSVLTRNEQWILLIISSLVAFFEGSGEIFYKLQLKKYQKTYKLLISFNYFKIGLIYGLFMDGFKIGS